MLFVLRLIGLSVIWNLCLRKRGNFFYWKGSDVT